MTFKISISSYWIEEGNCYMPIQPRNRAQGYIKGNQGYDLHLSVDPDEHFISAETGRPTIPTKTVDLKLIEQWYKALSTPIYMSDVVPQGQVVIIDHGALPYHHGAYLPPTDYYWVKHKDNPELAHKLVMSWIDQRIEKMAKEAESRLDAMVEEMEFKAAQKATYDRYKEQIKYYHYMFGDAGVIFVPFGKESENFTAMVEEGERIHREAEEEILRQEREDHKVDSMSLAIHAYNSYAGLPDDWHLIHPRTVEPKTSTIFNPRNGAV